MSRCGGFSRALDWAEGMTGPSLWQAVTAPRAPQKIRVQAISYFV
jgi:hypothetical protein